MEKQQKTSYQKLISYQKAKQLVLMIYRLTNSYPKEEFYCLVPQIRRAAISVVANIVEGYIKEKPKEYSRFLTISIGSLTELEVLIDISLELKYIGKDDFNEVSNLIVENKKLLYGSRKRAREKI
ncbi:MAG: 23S rRNA-intervening sequence protein [Candidatus Woesebacteria bacterium]|jgi:four helix bundle protein|nr:MAG: 23S rRNA-intervening sequence protein [Candidatus Woesebacteria bacterium]